MIGKFSVFVAGFLFLFSFTNCSSTKKVIKNNNITLSKYYYDSETSDLLIKIPSGWERIVDNSQKLFDFWIVSPDKNSSIIFIPLYADSTLLKNKKTIDFLFETNKKIKKNSINNFQFITGINTHKLNNLIFKGFVYKDNGKEKRSIIFSNGEKYYESLAYFNKSYSPTIEEIKNLFKIQDLVLSTVKIKP